MADESPAPQQQLSESTLPACYRNVHLPDIYFDAIVRKCTNMTLCWIFSRRLDTTVVVVIIDVAAAEAPQASLGERRVVGARVAARRRCSRDGVVQWRRAAVAGGGERGARLLATARRAGRHDVTVALAVSTPATVSLALYE